MGGVNGALQAVVDSVSGNTLRGYDPDHVLLCNHEALSCNGFAHPGFPLHNSGLGKLPEL